MVKMTDLAGQKTFSFRQAVLAIVNYGNVMTRCMIYITCACVILTMVIIHDHLSVPVSFDTLLIDVFGIIGFL